MTSQSKSIQRHFIFLYISGSYVHCSRNGVEITDHYLAVCTCNPLGPLYKHFIPAWIRNYFNDKVWDWITYPIKKSRDYICMIYGISPGLLPIGCRQLLRNWSQNNWKYLCGYLLPILSKILSHIWCIKRCNCYVCAPCIFSVPSRISDFTAISESTIWPSSVAQIIWGIIDPFPRQSIQIHTSGTPHQSDLWK